MDVKLENTLENWNKYRDESCKLPEETQKKQFNEICQLSGEYWLESCRDANSSLCLEHSEINVSIIIGGLSAQKQALLQKLYRPKLKEILC
ncbi:hypothetical protein AVEN_126577-1 [Araneus ventricosus]|uniref:Uncharacterized protein n=1 Tax=Araneus ventricosus TaxID=182803 RepID=A0A4Y2IBV5_ARAVE|nr:hypothetical protein AVEN_126577-1 [Araneus ventricosus]